MPPTELAWRHLIKSTSPPLSLTLWKPMGCHIFELLYLQRQPCARLLFTQPTKNNTVPPAPPGMHVRRPLPHLALSTLTSPHQHPPQAPPPSARCASSVFPQRPLSYLAASHRNPRPTSPHESPRPTARGWVPGTSCPATGRVIRLILSKRVAQLMRGRDRR
jgi:hypothetical protein